MFLFFQWIYPACVVCWYQSVVAEGGFCVLVSEEDDRRLCQNPDCRLRDTATRVSNFPSTRLTAHKLNVAFPLGKARQDSTQFLAKLTFRFQLLAGQGLLVSMAIITKRKRVKRLTSLRGSDLQQVVCKLLALSLSSSSSPWYNCTGWLGVKLQFTYSSSSSLFVCLFLVASKKHNLRIIFDWLFSLMVEKSAFTKRCTCFGLSD